MSKFFSIENIRRDLAALRDRAWLKRPDLPLTEEEMNDFLTLHEQVLDAARADEWSRACDKMRSMALIVEAHEDDDFRLK
jgi:hypothetical protein